MPLPIHTGPIAIVLTLVLCLSAIPAAAEAPAAGGASPPERAVTEPAADPDAAPAAAGSGREAHWRITAHRLSVELAPEAHGIRASDVITAACDSPKPPARMALLLNRDLEVWSVTLEGNPLSFQSAGAAAPGDFGLPADASEAGINSSDDTADGEKGGGHHGGNSGGDGGAQAAGFAPNARTIFVDLPAARLTGWDPGAGSELSGLEITYMGAIFDDVGTATFSRHSIADETTGLISAEGTYLGGAAHWYPDVPESMASFHVTTLTPAGVESVTLGGLAERETLPDGRLRLVWDNPHPADECSLVAGRYRIDSRTIDGVEVSTYFFPSEADLVDGYLEATVRYIRMYNEMIGPYPYPKFAVVENFFPTGYGMPSFTLLGRRVIRLPFIVHTSLGHEVAHNWWGNSVFVDYESGNWCEGLTTYVADHHYKSLQGAGGGAAYRRGICRDYTAYVNEENDFPLTDFRGRTTPASRAIGYGKSAMLFHMARVRLGDERFYGALQTVYRHHIWQRTSFDDFRAAFDLVSGEDFHPFFDQWASRTGAPLLRLEDVILEQAQAGEGGGAAWRVSGTLVQEQPGDPFELIVPMAVSMENGEADRRLLEVSAARTPFEIRVSERPTGVAADPDFDVFRRLHQQEIPATLSLLLGDPSAVIVLPSGGSEETRRAYRAMAERLSRTGEARVMPDSEVTGEILGSHALFVLGAAGENRLIAGELAGALPDGCRLDPDAFALNGTVYGEPGAAVLASVKNPLAPEKGICFFAGRSAAAVDAAAGKLTHYGKYSYLAFVDGANRDKGIREPEGGPMRRRF